MQRKNLINLLWLQGLWFVAVIGAASGLVWPAFVMLNAFIVWQLHPANHIQGDFPLVLVALLIGFILDSSWISLGLIQFSSPNTINNLAPLWILLLWVGLALTLNHSLAWLQHRLGLAAVCSAISSPLSYLGAERLGALQFNDHFWSGFFCIATSWAIVVPFLLWLARNLRSSNAM
ncbi:hypothetical protein AU255_14310 [Methyloprofundus sedimenti]|uniref:DUF2878 domain-containing protein n=1 Tax=Methyloprofundus sedimenti TaxID=1420851 RepID=A0A1V8M4D3_9GAMM|nr:DUF2878 domain-containing protein [Methyloprofundus sedimenti]OQK16263.1 hypothetical protein AU255_14310 [Methyloprofundus sedimenti]